MLGLKNMRKCEKGIKHIKETNESFTLNPEHKNISEL